MRFSSFLPGLLICSALGQVSDFEPEDFDVEQALASYGIPANLLLQFQSLPSGGSAGCSATCSVLFSVYNASVIQQNSSGYSQWEAAFWSQQQASVRPHCIFQPVHARQVSVAVLLSRFAQCPFAVKSGGHAAFAGASNIPGGITIDLKLLNQVTLSANKSTAHIGPGNTWYDVYTALEPEGVTVIGGRTAAIGVGGLTLGGGISFFSGLHGWACDNVQTYEGIFSERTDPDATQVVTASGLIIDVSHQSHPDLYWALRGGGNNFGIVTRFDLSAYPQGLMWQGSLVYPGSQNASLIQAFTDFGFHASQDPGAALYLPFVFTQGLWLSTLELTHAAPVASPAIFDEFYSIPAPLVNDTGITTLANITLQINESNPSGLRETYWTATYKLDADLASTILDIYVAEIEALGNVSGLLPALTLQVITEPMLQHMQKNGGNALGLSVEDGPYLLVLPSAMWNYAGDDAAVMQAHANFVQRMDAAARERGLYDEYIYMNYASQYQSVVPGYGKGNQERLESVAEMYDPKAVFQKLQPGYFKLDGVLNSHLGSYGRKI